MTTYLVCNIDEEDEKEAGRVGRKREYFIYGLPLISRTLSLVSFLYDVCGIIEKPTMYLGSLQRNPKKLRRVEP